MPENYTYDIACSGLAASGAVSSAISSITTGVCGAKINSKEWTAAITIAAGALSGGITSTIAGGDFWDGLCNGLISSGLNHALHLVADPPTKQYRVNKKGCLPLDSDLDGFKGGAVQWANYKMLYNVSVTDVPVLDPDTYDIIDTQRILTVTGTSSNTAVEGEVYPAANATVIVDGKVIGSKSLQVPNGEPTPFMPELSKYVGTASFCIPKSGDVILQMKGGWNVDCGSGFAVPMVAPLVPVPINANATIRVLTQPLIIKSK